MIYAHAHCSLDRHKQGIQRQTHKLKEAGAESTLWEFQHRDAKGKKEFNTLLGEMQAGDTLITLSVSRLSRSTQQLCEIIDIIRQKHLCLIIPGSITIDCRQGQIDPMSEAITKTAGVFSNLELQMIRNRIKPGMINAKAKGVKVGRKPTTKEGIPAVFYNPSPQIRRKNR